MLVHRGLVFRLRPTPAQNETLRQWIGTCRAVYNAALAQRRDHWRAYKRTNGKSLSYVGQARELTQLRADFDWIRACPITPQQQALRDLDRAYTNFFAGRARYPTPRKRGVYQAIRFQFRELKFEKLNRRNGRIRIPKLGWIRLTLSRDLIGDVANATISHDASGWSIAFSTAVEVASVAAPHEAVGIDRGVAHSIALSTGELPAFPREAIQAAVARKDAHQRRGSQRTRRPLSIRKRKSRQRAARQSAKAARIRKHANHVVTLEIARRFNVAVLEDLRIANMTASAAGTLAEPGTKVRQKAGLNRSILETGWGQFEQMLAYKMAERGGEIRLVDPRNTSRRCPQCGHVNARNRESQALFRCVACDHAAHADVNAGVNILQAGTRPSRSSQERRSRESRQSAHAA